jgi:hypothetical protein
MLLPEGGVKILDLGLAKLRERIAENPLEYEPQTQKGDFLGTPGYMAPEQMHSAAHVDIRADIYSLGCTFFFLLYGRAPTAKQSQDLPALLPTTLQTILDRMLAADPFARFQEPREVAIALDEYLRPPQKKRQTKAIAFAAILAFVCVAFTLLALFLIGKKDAPLMEAFPASSNDNVAHDGAILVKQPTYADVQAAVDLRYRGNSEQALEDLQKLEKTLRDNPFEGSKELLAEVLSAKGDCLFFFDHAFDPTVKRPATWYEESLNLTDETSVDFRTKILCKLAVVRNDAGRIPPDGAVFSLYRRFAEAVTAADEQALWNFIEPFELCMEAELLTREALDMRLFALERLISRSKNTDRESFLRALRLLDSVLLTPYLDADANVYLNRFFDLAIRSGDPNDYGQLVRYLFRLRPLGTAGGRTTFPPGATLFLLYFSPWSDAHGFAIYYPADRQESRRFELPFNRNAVKEAIRRGESLPLDAELVSLIRHDINSGVPIVLSWDDTACWALRRDALANEDWTFPDSITIQEILGQMK